MRPDKGLTGALLLLGVYGLAQLGEMDIVSTLRALQPSESQLGALLIVAAVLLVCATALLTGQFRALWHALANTFAVEHPRALRNPWVIDGDTIDDRGSGVRYRLANIDAPETGDNAKCFHERERGELATRAAIRLVRSANVTSVRRTWRTDRYGRRVAFVLVDGEDLGQALIELGLARPWRGKRERWCGRRGGLARIAETGAMPFACATCQNWR